MKTISKRIFAITPIIAFAVTIIISSGITKAIEHHHAATTNHSRSAGEVLNGSYSNLINTFDSSCVR